MKSDKRKKSLSAWLRSDNGKAYLRNREAARRVARKNGKTERISKEFYKQMLENQSGKCRACKVDLIAYEIDHIVPVSRGGTHTKDNLQLLCRSCNRQKHAFEWGVFLRRKGLEA